MNGEKQASAEGSRAPRAWALPAVLVLGLVGVACFLYVLFAASSKPEAGGLARYAKGELDRLIVAEAPPPRPARPVRDAAGAETTIAAIQGEDVVLVNLWATWCAPCIAELPSLAQLQRAYAGRGFRVVTVNFDTEADQEKAKAMLSELSGGDLPYLTDPTRAIMFDVAAGGMPTSILYDRDGQEIARLMGDADWAGEDARALIDAALGVGE